MKVLKGIGKGIKRTVRKALDGRRLLHRRIEYLALHCSDSGFGDEFTIDKWHKARGWRGCGYHKVFCNGYRHSLSRYCAEVDGLVEPGRDVNMRGAHVRGHNANSIGWCLIGGRDLQGHSVFDKWLTESQERSLFAELDRWFDLLPELKVVGHNHFNPNKGCPMLDMQALIRRYRKHRIVNHLTDLNDWHLDFYELPKIAKEA